VTIADTDTITTEVHHDLSGSRYSKYDTINVAQRLLTADHT